MRTARILTLCVLGLVLGCSNRWVFLTETPTTRHYLDTDSFFRSGESSWEVRERFLDPTTERWYLETEVRYDCRERTFMTLSVRGFSEHRPLAHESVLEGNLPVKVTPDSPEEARLEAVCALAEGRGGATEDGVYPQG